MMTFDLRDIASAGSGDPSLSASFQPHVDSHSKREEKKVLLLVNDNITGLIILNDLIPQMIANGIKPVICLLNPKVPERAKIQELRDFGFYDSQIGKQAIYPYLNSRPALVDDQGKPMMSVSYTIEQLRDLYHVDIELVTSANSKQFIRRVRKDQTLKGAISIRNLEIFKDDIIQAFQSKGFLWNLHSGLLPQYAGVHPQLRAMADKKSECGWTLHWIDDEGIDTGDIIGKTNVPLQRDASYLDSFHAKLPAASGLIIPALRTYFKTGSVPRYENMGPEFQYYSFPTNQEMRLFASSGVRLVDPNTLLRSLISTFSIPGTDHARGMAEALVTSATNWEHAKHAQPVRRKRKGPDLDLGALVAA